jgi:hypothetical protein
MNILILFLMELKCTVYIQSTIITRNFMIIKRFFYHRNFQEILLVFKTNRFMTINPVYYEQQDDLIEGKTKIHFLVDFKFFHIDFRFEPYISHLRSDDVPVPSTTANRRGPTVNDLMTLPP